MTPDRTFARLALVFAAVLIAALFVVLRPAAAETTAEIFNGFQAKSNDPVQVDAGVLEISEEGKQRISVFRDNVVVRRGRTTLRAAEIRLYSPLDGSAADGFTRIEASGKVIVDSGEQTVSGQKAVVDMTKRTITVSGGVVLTQGENVITGSRLVVNLATGQARVEQEPGKRIRGVFTPDAAQSLGKQ